MNVEFRLRFFSSQFSNFKRFFYSSFMCRLWGWIWLSRELFSFLFGESMDRYYSTTSEYEKILLTCVSFSSYDLWLFWHMSYIFLFWLLNPHLKYENPFMYHAINSVKWIDYWWVEWMSFWTFEFGDMLRNLNNGGYKNFRGLQIFKFILLEDDFCTAYRVSSQIF